MKALNKTEKHEMFSIKCHKNAFLICRYLGGYRKSCVTTLPLTVILISGSSVASLLIISRYCYLNYGLKVRKSSESRLFPTPSPVASSNMKTAEVAPSGHPFCPRLAISSVLLIDGPKVVHIDQLVENCWSFPILTGAFADPMAPLQCSKRRDIALQNCYLTAYRSLIKRNGKLFYFSRFFCWSVPKELINRFNSRYHWLGRWNFECVWLPCKVQKWVKC